MQQLEMAKIASLGIQYLLNHLSDELESLTHYPDVQYFELEPLRANIDHFYRHHYQKSLKAIFVVEGTDRIVYSTMDSLPKCLNLVLEKRMKAQLSDKQLDSVWFSQVMSEDPGKPDSKLCMFILAPLVQNFKDPLHLNPSNKVVSLVGCLVDFEWLMAQFIYSLKVGTTGFAWVMDHNGRLLFHPQHPEMVLRSIYSTDKGCQNCHDSFAIQANLIDNPLTYQEYQVANEPVKITAQAPLYLLNEKWIIAVSSDLAEVTAIVKKNFRLFFWLVGLVLTSVISGGIFLLYINIRRVHAEAQSQFSEEKQLLQEQIYNSAKLASIGELVESVVHEINTPITIISAQINALLLEAKKLPYKDVVNIVNDQVRRIGNYTKSLMRFSRSMKFYPEPNDMIEMTEECLFLLGHRFRANNIELNKIWSKDLPKVQVDRDQMQQVILNLLNNAVDAVNGNGEICIKIQSHNSDSTTSGIELAISDNGHGINSESLLKVFDPFFSTKSPDKGTGLGLAISHAIIERHGGRIKVESKEGNGACFIVFIPHN